MSFFKKQRTLLLGAGLILLTNAIALAGVAYNRSGSPESVLQLSERELGYYSTGNQDNSGVSVKFRWRVTGDSLYDLVYGFSWSTYSRRASWLNSAKLKQLGFDIAKPAFPVTESENYDRLKDREVFLVLEFNGPAYRNYVARVKESEKDRADVKMRLEQIARAEKEETRLFVVDAGTNVESLRQRYPDKNMYVIVKGIVSAAWETNDEEPELLVGSIKSLSVSSLHVSKPDDAVFSSIPMNDGSGKYQVKVAYGRRYEPWILSATK